MWHAGWRHPALCSGEGWKKSLARSGTWGRRGTGLPVASVVRTAKIATIEAKEAERIGSLCEPDRKTVIEHMIDILPLY